MSATVSFVIIIYPHHPAPKLSQPPCSEKPIHLILPGLTPARFERFAGHGANSGRNPVGGR
jgi:hypothetical protein